MREIKFRIWHEAKKTFYFFPQDSLRHRFEVYLNDNEFIVQQYTGQKDKDGKEIYEGDILEITQRNGFKFIGEVEFGHLWYHGQRHGFIGFAVRDKEVDACFPLFTFDLNDGYVDVKIISNTSRRNT